jgi:hypothetical protein
MTTNIELYEALKPSVGEDAARMIADVVPPARDLATHLDVQQLRTELVEHRRQTDVRFEELRHSMEFGLEELRRQTDVGFEALKGVVHAASMSTTRWMLTFFVPLWLAMLATVVTIALRGISR